MFVNFLSLFVTSLLLTNCQTTSSIFRQKNLTVNLRFNVLFIENENNLKYFTYTNKEGKSGIFFEIVIPNIPINIETNIEKIMDIPEVFQKVQKQLNILLTQHQEKYETLPSFLKATEEKKIIIIKEKFLKNWSNKNNLMFVFEDNYSQILDPKKTFNQIKNISKDLTIDIYYNNPNDKLNMFVRKPIINVGLIAEDYQDIKDFLKKESVKGTIMDPSREKVFNEAFTNGTLKYHKKVWKKIFEKETEHKKRIYKQNNILLNGKLKENGWAKYTILELENKIVFLHHLSYEDLYFYYHRSIYWSNIYYRQDEIFTSLITLYKGKEYYKYPEVISLTKSINYAREYKNAYFYDLNSLNNINITSIINDKITINQKSSKGEIDEIKKKIDSIISENNKKIKKNNLLFSFFRKIRNVFKKNNKQQTYMECITESGSDINKIRECNGLLGNSEEEFESRIIIPAEEIELNRYDSNSLLNKILNIESEELNNYEEGNIGMISYFWKKDFSNLQKINKKKVEDGLFSINPTWLDTELSNLILEYIALIIKNMSVGIEKDESNYSIKVTKNNFKNIYTDNFSSIIPSKLYIPMNVKNTNILFSNIVDLKVESSQFNSTKDFFGTILNVYDKRKYNFLDKNQLLLACYFNEGVIDRSKTYYLLNEQFKQQPIKIKDLYNLFGEKITTPKIESSHTNKKIGIVINRQSLTIAPEKMSIYLKKKTKETLKKKYCLLNGYLFINDFNNSFGFDSNLNLISKDKPSTINYLKMKYENGKVNFCIENEKCNIYPNNTNRGVCGDDIQCSEPTNDMHLYYNGSYYLINKIIIKEIILYNPTKNNNTIFGSQKIYMNILNSNKLEFRKDIIFRCEFQLFGSPVPFFPKTLPHLRLCYTQKKNILNTGGRRSTKKIKKKTKSETAIIKFYEKETVGLIKITDQNFYTKEADKIKDSTLDIYETVNMKGEKNNIIFVNFKNEKTRRDEKLESHIKKYHLYLPIPENDTNYLFFNNSKGPIKDLLTDITETFDFGYDFFRMEKFTVNNKEKNINLFRLGSEYGNYGNFFTYREIKKGERLKKVTNIAIRDFWIIPNQSFSHSGIDSKGVIKLTLNKERCITKDETCSNISKNLMTFFIGKAGDQGGIYSGGEQQIVKLTSKGRENKNACFYPKNKSTPWEYWNQQILDDQTCQNKNFEGKNNDDGDFDGRLKDNTFDTLEEPYKSGVMGSEKLFFRFPNGDQISSCSYKIKGDNIYTKCVYYYSNDRGEYGGSYEATGEMKNFLPHGFGRKKYQDGSIYEGQWYNGHKYGKGTYTFPRDRWAGAPEYKMEGYWNQVKKFKGEWYFLGKNYQNKKNSNKYRWYKL
jgi:hypothetical protein